MSAISHGRGHHLVLKLPWHSSSCLCVLAWVLVVTPLVWDGAARSLDCSCAPSGSSASVCDQQCQEQQRQALVALYEAWAGAHWRTKDGWLSEQHHCRWQGVSCCPDSSSHLTTPKWSPEQDTWQLIDLSGCCCSTPGAVSALQLPSNNVTGHFAALGVAAPLFGTLLLINLENNRLAGSVQGIQQFQQLQGLYLTNNTLAGSIPSDIGSLNSLKALSVEGNALTGTIPVASVLQMQQLELLWISANRFTGTVPLELLSLPRLLTLEADQNSFTGSLVVPQQLVAMDSNGNYPEDYIYTGLNVNHNKLTGTIPPELVRVVGETLDLSSNSLTGTLPLVENHVLRMLRLRDNKLSGTLPQELGSWGMLELDLGYNMFEGTLPAVLQTLNDLVVLRVEGNRGLVGTIPEALVLNQHMAVIDARGTSMQQSLFESPVNSSFMTAVPTWMFMGAITLTIGDDQLMLDGNRTGEASPTCPYPLVKGSQTLALLDPYYYQFEGCTCTGGATPLTERSTDGAVIDFHCIPVAAPKGMDTRMLVDIVVPVCVVVGFLLAVGLVAHALLRMGGKSAVDMLKTNRKRARPPQEGQPLTLVLTDVAGSTALWEWDTEQAAKAIDLHDRIMRDYLSLFCGYEVTTEGDAFLVAFHEPGDAIAYCLTVQIALQEADWSEEVLEWCQQHLPSPFKPVHAPTSPARSVAGTESAASNIQQQEGQPAAAVRPHQLIEDFFAKQESDHQQLTNFLPPAEELFRGLRVRMAVATGVAEVVKLHKVTGRVEYWGHAIQKAQAMADAVEGGQVLMDSETFRGINTRLPQKGERVMAALAQKGLRQPGFAADPPRLGRRAHSIDYMEHAMGGNAVMAAAAAQRHSTASTPRRLTAYQPHEAALEPLQQYDLAVPMQQSPAEPSLGQSPVGKSRKSSYDAGILQEMHDTLGGFPEDWSTMNNATIDNACDLAGGAYRATGRCRAEGSFGGQAPARQPATSCRLAGAAAAFKRSCGIGSQREEHSAFCQLLAASGASFTAAGLGSNASSPRQTAVLNSDDLKGRNNLNPSPAKCAVGNQPGAIQPANAVAWTESSLYVTASPEIQVGGNQSQPSSNRTSTDSTVLTCTQLAQDLEGSLAISSEAPPQSSEQLTYDSYSQSSNPYSRSTGRSCSTADSTHTTTFLHNINQHQLSMLGGRSTGSTDQLQRLQYQDDQHAADSAGVQEQSIVPLMELGDSDEEQNSESLQLSMLKGKTRKQLTPGTAGTSPVLEGAVAAARAPALWQQDCGQQEQGGLPPTLSQDRRTLSAPEATILAATSGQISKGIEPTSYSFSVLDAAAGSRSADFDRHRPGTATKSANAKPAGSRLRTGSNWGGRMLQRTASHTSSAWSDKLYAVVERVAGNHPYLRRSSMGHRVQLDDGWHFQERAGHGQQQRNSPAPSQQPTKAVMVLDMGIHKLAGIAEPIQLVSALPPGLEARAHYYPPLSTQQQQTPGYLDAPATAASPLAAEPAGGHTQLGLYESRPAASRQAGALAVARSICVLPPVVMVFCAVDGYHDMIAANRLAAEDMLQQYSDVVRWTLLVAGGYECQEQEGNYMIAFDAPGAALEWALLVQEALLEVTWSSQVMALPGAGEIMSNDTGQIQFRGPRVRIGLYRGVPTRVVPHSTTGRADYFGPLVNRAARYCHTAAHAGQVVAPRDMLEELVHEWCGVHPAHLPDASGPPWTITAEPRVHDQGRVCWARNPVPRAGGLKSARASVTQDGRILSGSLFPASAMSGLSRREMDRTLSSAGSARSGATLLDIVDLPAGSSIPVLNKSSALRSSSGSMTASRQGSFSGFPGEGRAAGGLKIAHTASMKRAMLVPDDLPTPHPVPDLSSLLTLRKVAADQQQQQEEEQATSKVAAAAAEGQLGGNIGSGTPAGKPKSAATVKRLPVKDRRSTAGSNTAGRKLSGGFDLDCGLAAALYARLVLHKWKWADTLYVYDIGEYSFKGINGSHSLVSVSSKALAGRKFPHRLRKAKGEQITKGHGLLYQLEMVPPPGPTQQPLGLLSPPEQQQDQRQVAFVDDQPSNAGSRLLAEKRTKKIHRKSTGSVAGILHTNSRFAQMQGIDVTLFRSRSDCGEVEAAVQEAVEAVATEQRLTASPQKTGASNKHDQE